MERLARASRWADVVLYDGGRSAKPNVLWRCGRSASASRHEREVSRGTQIALGTRESLRLEGSRRSSRRGAPPAPSYDSSTEDQGGSLPGSISAARTSSPVSRRNRSASLPRGVPGPRSGMKVETLEPTANLFRGAGERLHEPFRMPVEFWETGRSKDRAAYSTLPESGAHGTGRKITQRAPVPGRSDATLTREACGSGRRDLRRRAAPGDRRCPRSSRRRGGLRQTPGSCLRRLQRG